MDANDTHITPSYDTEPLAKVPYSAEYNVFAIETQHTEQPENMNDTSLMEKVYSNTTPDSSDMCNNEFKDDQYADDHEDKRVILANLIIPYDKDDLANIFAPNQEETLTLEQESRSKLHKETIKKYD
ncbi:hypothetical protein Tco_1105684 [Tanacetum coccineum]